MFGRKRPPVWLDQRAMIPAFFAALARLPCAFCCGIGRRIVAFGLTLLLATPFEVGNAYASAPTSSDGQRVGVVGLIVKGALTQADRATLNRALVAGLKRGRFEVQVLAHAPDEGCDAACWRALAAREGVDYFVLPVVSVRDRDFAVEVRLIDAKTGQLLAENRQACEICGISEADSLLASAAATLRTKIEAVQARPAELRLDSQPRGASVFLDGQALGETPLAVQVVPGRHQVEVKLKGYEVVRREFDFVAGVRESSTLTLREEKVQRAPHRGWQLAAMGMGLGMIAGGVALLAIDRREYLPDCDPNGSSQDAQGDCRYLWNTKWAGAALGMAGAALGGVGLTWRLIDRKTQRDRSRLQARFKWSPGQVIGAQFQGRF